MSNDDAPVPTNDPVDDRVRKPPVSTAKSRVVLRWAIILTITAFACFAVSAWEVLLRFAGSPLVVGIFSLSRNSGRGAG